MESDDLISGRDKIPENQSSLLSDPNGETGEIILSVPVDTGHLGRFSTEQRAAGLAGGQLARVAVDIRLAGSRPVGVR